MTAPDPAAMRALADRLEAAARDDPVLTGAGQGALVRLVPGKRALIAGRCKGRAAIFRVFLRPGDEAPGREWAELTRAWAEMASGRYRVAEPLHYAAGHAILAVEQVPGTPLLKHLWQSAPAARLPYLRPAADWLRRYSDSTACWRRATPSGWLARARRATTRQPFAELRPLEAALLDELTPLARRIEGGDWRVAICHGDFHPDNLIVNAPRLTGIDTGGSARMPVCKDIARFLVHMARRGMVLSGESWLGVDRAGFAAFAESFALTEAERLHVLPFMIGIEALIRVESRSLTRARIAHAARMYEAMLDDLRKPAAAAP